jgi:hypothetical protein
LKNTQTGFFFLMYFCMYGIYICLAVSVLPKPNKTVPQKAAPGAWRPISLLNAVGKVIEAAFARLIADAAKARQLLRDGQMGNKRDRSTDLAIRMMVEMATEAR